MANQLDLNSDPIYLEREILRLRNILQEQERLKAIRAARSIDLLEDVHAEFIPKGETGRRLEAEPSIDIWTDSGSVSLLLYQFDRLVGFVREQLKAHRDK